MSDDAIRRAAGTIVARRYVLDACTTDVARTAFVARWLREELGDVEKLRERDEAVCRVCGAPFAVHR